MSDLEDAAVERELARRGASLGRPLSIAEVTSSTNDDARRAAAAGAPHGATFIADRQTGGRGRGDHAWYSPPGENLYMSVVVRPRAPVGEVASLGLVVGIAVARSLERWLPERALQVKWPNDVLASDKKLAGILLEAQIRGDRASQVVIGVGVNVRAERFPPDLALRATSLALLGARAIERAVVAAALLADLGDALARFDAEGFSAFRAELAGRDALAGRAIEVDGVRGIARGFDAIGRLILTSEGTELTIASGSVTLL